MTNCSGIIEPGYFHPGNAFLFYLEPNSNETLKDLVFSHHYIKRHGRVVIFEPSYEQSAIHVRNFNVYKNRSVLSGKWSLKAPPSNLADIFPHFPLEVRISSIGEVYYCLNSISLRGSLFESELFLLAFWQIRLCSPQT